MSQDVILRPGAPFDLQNTTPGAIDLSVTTARGSIIRVTLPPGGAIRIDPTFEDFNLFIAPAIGAISEIPSSDS